MAGILTLWPGERIPAPMAGEGSRPRPLASDEQPEFAPSLSPDGRFVAFNWEREDASGIYVAPTAGGAPRRLLTEPDAPLDLRPRWSPDGSRIAFLRPAGPTTWEVRVSLAEGGGSKRFAEIAGTSLSWTPDGEALAVIDRAAPDAPYAAFLISSTTGDRLRRLTAPENGTLGDMECAVSPDGRRVAVARSVSIGVADLYVVDLHAGDTGSRRITFDAANIDGLAWTPRGAGIVFGSTRQGRQALWQVAADPTPGEAPSVVPGTEAQATSPSVSRPPPGGPAALAYVHDLAQVSVWRWSHPAGRAALVERAFESSAFVEHPVASPDGRLVVFSSSRSGQSSLWISATDGSHARRLALREGGRPLTPRWSPDNGWIAYASAGPTNRRIFVVRVDGSDLRRLTSEPSDEANPSWSRDGTWIYFSSNRTGRPRIWKTRADGSDVAVPVTEGEGTQALESPDGKTLYFVRRPGATGLFSMPVEGGPETEVMPGTAVWEGSWGLTRDGIAFLDRTPVNPHRGRLSLRRYRYDTRRVEDLASLSADPRGSLPWLSATVESQAVYWSQTESVRSDLMIIAPWSPRTP